MKRTLTVLAAIGLSAPAWAQGLELARRPHIDPIHGIRFPAPKDWQGAPGPSLDWAQRVLGDADIDRQLAGETQPVARYKNLALGASIVVVRVWGPQNLDDVREGTMAYLESMESMQSAIANLAAEGPAGAGWGPITSEGDFNPGVPPVWEHGGLFGRAGSRNVIVVWVYSADLRKGFGIAMATGAAETAQAPDPEHTGATISREAGGRLIDAILRGFEPITGAALLQARNETNWTAIPADWKTEETAHYTIFHNTPDEFAEKIGNHLEGIRRLYATFFEADMPKVLVRMFNDEPDFYFGTEAYGAAAYWSPAKQEIVGYRFQGGTLKLDSGEEAEIEDPRQAEHVTFRVLYHEAFHQYMFYVVMGARRTSGRRDWTALIGNYVEIPYWINEGYGDFFFGGSYEADRRGRPRAFRIGINSWRIETIQQAIRDNRHIPLSEFIYWERSQYYGNPGLAYAQGWALAHFLSSRRDLGGAENQRLSSIPGWIITQIQTRPEARPVIEEAFRGIDMTALEEEWKAYILGLEVPESDLPPLNPGTPPEPDR